MGGGAPLTPPQIWGAEQRRIHKSLPQSHIAPVAFLFQWPYQNTNFTHSVSQTGQMAAPNSPNNQTMEKLLR